MQQLSDLLKDKEYKIKKGSERADLIKFFLENIMDKNGNPYKPARMAVLLSHIKTSDLHYSISIFRDTERRRGKVSAIKEFWWSLRPQK